MSALLPDTAEKQTSILVRFVPIASVPPPFLIHHLTILGSGWAQAIIVICS